VKTLIVIDAQNEFSEKDTGPCQGTTIMWPEFIGMSKKSERKRGAHCVGAALQQAKRIASFHSWQLGSRTIFRVGTDGTSSKSIAPARIQDAPGFVLAMYSNYESKSRRSRGRLSIQMDRMGYGEVQV
jgi:hypothetical protein